MKFRSFSLASGLRLLAPLTLCAALAACATTPSSTALSAAKSTPKSTVAPSGVGTALSSSPEPTSGIGDALTATLPTPKPIQLNLTAKNCTWAIVTLKYDAQLDNSEVNQVATGADTRYGSPTTMVGNQTLLQYYQAYAAEWTKVVSVLSNACAVSPVLPTKAQSANALSWFTKAISAHQNDALAHPDSASWDNQWIANYQRLISMFAA